MPKEKGIFQSQKKTKKIIKLLLTLKIHYDTIKKHCDIAV